MSYTDNPTSDFSRYYDELERHVAKLPVCCECDEPILDEEYYEIDGKIICPTCLVDNHRMWTENYYEGE